MCNIHIMWTVHNSCMAHTVVIGISRATGSAPGRAGNRRTGQAVQAEKARTDMDKPTQSIEYETMLLGRHTHMTFPRVVREDRRLDRSAYILLSRIRVEGPMSIRQLSDAFGLDQSTLNRQTSAILRDGLVERIPDPEG